MNTSRLLTPVPLSADVEVIKIPIGQIVEILRPVLDCRGQRDGQNKLSVEDPLLVVLEHW